MASSKTWKLGVAAALIAAAVAAFLLLHRAGRGEMELLELLPPDLDLYAVADLQSLRAIPAVQKWLADPPGLHHDAEYDDFLRATGFRYQDDLHLVALGKTGDDWVGAARAHIDRARVTPYLDSQGAGKKDVSGRTVYTFGSIRPFRLVLLDDRPEGSLVAFTIGGDDSRIRQEIARRAGDLRDSAASELDRGDDRKHIPPGSKFWLIARPERFGGNDEKEAQFGSLGLSRGMLKGSKTVYISLQGGPAQLELRAEDYCDSPASAQRITGTLRAILALLRAMPPEKSAAGKPASLSPAVALAGIELDQAQQSVVLRWRLDSAVLSLLESYLH